MKGANGTSLARMRKVWQFFFLILASEVLFAPFTVSFVCQRCRKRDTFHVVSPQEHLVLVTMTTVDH